MRKATGLRRQKKELLFVGNLPLEATPKSVSHWLARCGFRVSAVAIDTDSVFHKPRGCAYVDPGDENETAIIRACNGRMFGGRTVVIQKALASMLPATI